jgi:hypothetical protein
MATVNDGSNALNISDFYIEVVNLQADEQLDIFLADNVTGALHDKTQCPIYASTMHDLCVELRNVE